MSPTDIRLAIEAHREPVEALSEYFEMFPMIPRYITENLVAFEIAVRIRAGIRSRERLVRCGIGAALTNEY